MFKYITAFSLAFCVGTNASSTEKFKEIDKNYSIKSLVESKDEIQLPLVKTIKEAHELAEVLIAADIEFWNLQRDDLLQDKGLVSIVTLMQPKKTGIENVKKESELNGVSIRNPKSFSTMKMDMSFLFNSLSNFMSRDEQVFGCEKREGETQVDYLKRKEEKEIDRYKYNTYKNISEVIENLSKVKGYLLASKELDFKGKKKEYQKFSVAKEYLSTKIDTLLKDNDFKRSLYTTSTIKPINKLLKKDEQNISYLNVDLAVKEIGQLITQLFTTSRNKIKKQKMKEVPLDVTSSILEVLEDPEPIVVELTEVVPNQDKKKREFIEPKALDVLTPPNITVSDSQIGEELDSTVEDNFVNQNDSNEIKDIPQKEITKKKQANKASSLTENEKDVVRALLGLGKEYANTKVPIKTFTDIIEKRGGHVIRTKTNVKFIMPIINNPEKLVSTAMHPLHKDNKDEIPRNTRYYWDRAKSLFENAGVQELLEETFGE